MEVTKISSSLPDLNQGCCRNFQVRPLDQGAVQIAGGEGETPNDPFLSRSRATPDESRSTLSLSSQKRRREEEKRRRRRQERNESIVRTRIPIYSRDSILPFVSFNLVSFFVFSFFFFFFLLSLTPISSLLPL